MASKEGCFYILKEPVDWGTSWERTDPALGTPCVRPTLAQMTPLARDAFNSGKKEWEQVRRKNRKIMDENGMWAFTGMLYVPGKGVYVQDNPEVAEGMPHLLEGDLEIKLGHHDPTVRFVPNDNLRTGEMSADELALDDYVVALAVIRGARSLAEIASHYGKRPWVADFGNSRTPKIGVASIYGAGGKRLELNKFSPRTRGGSPPYAFAIGTVSIGAEEGNEDDEGYFAFEVERLSDT